MDTSYISISRSVEEREIVAKSSSTPAPPPSPPPSPLSSPPPSILSCWQWQWRERVGRWRLESIESKWESESSLIDKRGVRFMPGRLYKDLGKYHQLFGRILQLLSCWQIFSAVKLLTNILPDGGGVQGVHSAPPLLQSLVKGSSFLCNLFRLQKIFFKVESLVFQLEQLDHFRNRCRKKLAIDFLSPQLSNQSKNDSNSFGSFKSISIEWGRKYLSKFDWIYHPSQPIAIEKVMNEFTFWRNPSLSWAISAGSILEVMLLMISNDD